ncbi:mitochondrial carrier domain-containing protein [Tribonema minus]|uniref:Mitochondrial carrier domain-containing protein n=1 Tax=Tribonema minus TaxID=303371 RepID=A0A835Z2W7_9STRA|nr:mitochondrial carrier domain-containing protein [Tribonema minus]
MADKKVKTTVALTSGTIAGGLEAISVWPMEFMKTQLQLMEKLPPGEKPKFTGVFSGIAYTVRTTGFLSLYRGLAPTLIGSMPKAGIRFGGNNFLKKQLADKNGKLTPTKQFAAGFGAGVVEALVAVTPIETIKTKAIQGNMPFVAGVKHILKTEGPAGLYQGAGATVLKQGSNQGLRFMWFNEYKKWLMGNTNRTLSPLENLLGGMSAGTFSTLGNNPFDVVKTRMQGLNANRYSSTLDCFAKIMTQEGIKGFYKGIVPRLGRVIPGQGIIFMSYEAIQKEVSKYM